MKIQSFLLSMAMLVAPAMFAQSPSERAAVQLNATAQASPAGITLTWPTMSSTTSITVYRKLRNATSWGTAIASPGASATQYTDNTVAMGTAYEYKVVRVSAGVTGTGYINTGIQLPVVPSRGKIILLVDNTLSGSLAAELTQLRQDLKADGWGVLRSDVSPTASVSSVRSTVQSQYNTDPANVKALFIIGHVPVPYSGNQAPDGHGTHQGAWPCDAYYGDLNGSWTDNSVNATGVYAANVNVPGDGKFDQTDLPSALELQVGRVDMRNMPAFGQSETELMRSYLNKLHAYKVKGFVPTMRGMVFDNLQWVSNPLAASGWRSIAPLVGASTITAPYQYGSPFKTLVNGQSYLWTYSSGGGLQGSAGGALTFNGADNIGTTEDYAALSGGMDGVFNMSFGSYFGDWDNPNNFLRAPLANGDALTNVWSSIPAWYFHHMGMGEPIGTSVLATMNNTGLYSPVTDGWQGSIGRVHLALMGDPSLRQQMVAPPSALNVSNVGGAASFTWTAAAESVLGYYLYQLDAAGTSTALVSTPITGTSYQNASIPYVAGREYMVRAVKLQTSPSGTYYDLSLGALKTAGGSTPTDCLGVVGGSALPGSACNDGNACTTNDVWNASCQCTGTPVTPVATITAAGSTTFCTGGSVTLNANTGTGLTYTWKKNAVTISGASAASYTATTAGSYTVTVTNGTCSATSTATTVTVSSSAQTATISASGPTTFCTGGSVVLTANSGTGLTYQWLKNGVWITGATGINYTATTSGNYGVTVSNGGCSATSPSTTVTAGSASTATITAAGSTTFCTGGSVVLNANTGAGFTYVWKKNAVTISGATSASYTATTSGSYTVTVSSGTCTATSSATTVTASSSAQTATITPSGPTAICGSGSVVLNANTGAGLTYIWKKNAATISGATAASYMANSAGTYTVTVSNESCSATSANTVVTIGSGFTVACGAVDAAGEVNVVVTGGSAPYSYSWNTVPVQTTSTAYVPESGVYTVVVTDAGGCTASCATVINVTASGSSPGAGTGSACEGIRTESQTTWGATPTTGSPAAYLASNWAAAFPTGLTIGCTRKLKFTSAAAVTAFLPSSGTTTTLPSGTLTNPTTYANSLAGELVAVKIALRMDELDPNFSPSSVYLRDMVITSGTYTGWSVQQLVVECDKKIGGCTSIYTLSSMRTALANINTGYEGGLEDNGYLTCEIAPRSMDAGPEVQGRPDLIDASLALRAFPNPTSGPITLELTGAGKADATYILEVHTPLGVLIHQDMVKAGGSLIQVKWDATGSAPGIYLCTMRSGDAQVVTRVMVE